MCQLSNGRLFRRRPKGLTVRERQLVIELYGQDRFILGRIETGKITDDREQLCCPTLHPQFYKWNGKNFLLQGKRLTFPLPNRQGGTNYQIWAKR